MQQLAVIRMGAGNRLVDLDAEAGLLRRNHIACFPADRAFQEFRMESSPGLNRLQDEKVGTAGADLNVRRPDNGDGEWKAL